MFKAYVPKITLSGSDTRKGDGIGMRCNGQTMLFDGFEGGEPTNNLMSWLASEGVEVIDTVVLSHVHYDHYNGLLQILKKFKIKLLYMYDPLTLKHGCDGSANGRAVKEDMDNAYAFIRKMQSYGTRVLWLDKGATIPFGDVTWKVYRNQPTHFTDLDDGHAYAFVNDGSLVLWSPETQLLLGGDGPSDIKDAIKYFGAKVSGYDIAHHGNSCSMSNAQALKTAGCVVAWETCVERNGAGTTSWTEYGARRVKQQGIPVWMQDAPISITAANGKITFQQGDKTLSKAVSYNGKGEEGWVKNQKGWWYKYADGSYAKGWAKLKWSKGTNWFYFGSDGYMKTGWQKVNGKWYYLDPKTGAMLTGWIYVSGVWYYLEDSGAMRTGWMDWKERRCYLDPANGHCLVNCTAVIDGKTYRFDKDGYATEVKAVGNITTVSGKLNDISASRRQFVIDIANYVRKYAPQYGIEVYSPVIAQAIHESGWGESSLAAKYHNYFGLKCGTAWKGKSVNLSTKEEYSAGTLTTISANFRVYDNMEQGVKGYFEFIQLTRYANLKGVTSPRKYLENIIADGYATGKSYVDHVMNLINLYNLTQFDVPVTQSEQTTEDPIDYAISLAESYVGYHEGANNKTIFGDTMHEIQPSNMDANAPWCDAFVDFIILKTCEHFGKGTQTAKNVLCGDFDDYTYASVNLYKKAGRWSNTAHRGDQIFFGGSGHTGIVTDVQSGVVHTIEGNKGDEVRKCSYSTSTPSIIGYGRPRYDLITGKLTAADMPLLKKGAQGVDVETLQKMLIAKGYSCGASGADGSFGAATEAAVKKYQQDHGLTADGECGPITWNSLFG